MRIERITMKHFFIILLSAGFLFTACTSQNNSDDNPTAQSGQASSDSLPIIITDALGREVALPNAPNRIVVTGKALIMVVDALYMFPEAYDHIAALGNAGQGDSNFIRLIDPNYSAKATLQHDAGVEQIAATQPDLVILKSYLSDSLGKSLEVLNIPVVYVDFETPEQYERDIAILGKVFQNEPRAQEVTAYYQTKVAEIQIAIQGVSDKPRGLMLYYTDKDGAVAFNVPPKSWMQTLLVERAGGDPVWTSIDLATGWTKVTLEQIAAWDADQIFIISYAKNPSEIVADLLNDTQWQKLRAVQQGHLYAFPGDLYSWDQADARWILGLSWLADRFHPDCFPQFNIVQEANQFYQTLYRLDALFFEEKIRPTFKGDLP